MASSYVPARVMFALLAVCIAGTAQAQPRPRLDVPYVPTPEETVGRMLDMAGVTKDDFLIDLGSGDGRIVIAAAKRFGTRGLGIDIDPRRIEEARANARAAGVANLVEFRQQNLFETDIAPASVLTMYLLGDVNMRLRPRILGELRPGTRVVSHSFDLGDWKPDNVTADRKGLYRVYSWVVPARAEGVWKVETPAAGQDAIEIEIAQRFQEIRGIARRGGRTAELMDARLTGDRIAFSFEDTHEGRPVAMRWAGRIAGDVIEGSIGPAGASQAASGEAGGTGQPWRAVRTSP